MAPTNSEDITMFYTSIGATVSKVISVVRGQQGSGFGVGFQLRYDADRSATGTVIGSVTATSFTNGVQTTSFDNASIPADRFVWLETTGVQGAIDELNVTMEF
jgi:hypothetical protein